MRVWDAGCGSGNISIACSQKAGLIISSDIIHRNLQFLNQIRDREGLKNIGTILTFLEEVGLKSNSIDIIIFSEVIEHLNINSIQKTIDEFYRVLKPGGLLFLTTPNYLSFWPIIELLTDLTGKAAKMKNEQHISKFNIFSLKNLLKRHGLKIKKTGTFNFISPFIAPLGLGLSSIINRLENKFDIKMGSLLYCVAQKKNRI